MTEPIAEQCTANAPVRIGNRHGVAFRIADALAAKWAADPAAVAAMERTYASFRAPLVPPQLEQAAGEANT